MNAMLQGMKNVLILCLALVACNSREVPILVNNWCDTPREHTVLEITDGDTLVLDNGEIVRILGIDAPEKYYNGHPDCASGDSPDCCYGDQATSALLEIAPPGTSLRLEFDLECKGLYERTLAYLFVVNADTGADEIFLNEWLLEEGHVQVYSGDVGHAQDIRYLERFQAAQSKAQSANKGLWDQCY
jgi:micrococcal nuclease